MPDNPEDQGLSPKEMLTDVDRLESRHVASEKLETLSRPDFHDFAVRFVNIEEYQQIVENGHISGREATIIKNDFGPIDFQTFIGHSKSNWPQTIESMTDWHFNVRGLKEYKILVDLFKQASSNVKENHETEDIKAQTLLEFRRLLLDRESSINLPQRERSGFGMALSQRTNASAMIEKTQQADNYYGDIEAENRVNAIYGPKAGEIYAWLDKLVVHFGAHSEELDEYLDEYIDQIERSDIDKTGLKSDFKLICEKKSYDLMYGGKNRIDLVKEFFENPGNFTTNARTHELLLALSHGSMAGGNPDLQNQVAVIFDMKAVYDNPNGNWGNTRAYNRNEQNDWADSEWAGVDPATTVLGAVALIPDSTFVQKIAKMSESGISWSHPVFDSQGRVAYPVIKKV